MDKFKNYESLYYLNVPCIFIQYSGQNTAIITVEGEHYYDDDEDYARDFPLTVNPKYLTREIVVVKNLDNEIKEKTDSISVLEGNISNLSKYYDSVKNKVASNGFTTAERIISNAENIPDVLINIILRQPIYKLQQNKLGNGVTFNIHKMDRSELREIRIRPDSFEIYWDYSSSGVSRWAFASEVAAQEFIVSHIKKEISAPRWNHTFLPFVNYAKENKIDVSAEFEIGNKILQDKKQKDTNEKLEKAEAKVAEYKKSLEGK